MHNLQKRLLSGPSLIAAILIIAYWAPSASIGTLLAAIAVLALWEFYQLLDRQGIPSFRIMGAAFGVALIILTWGSYSFRLANLASEQEMFVMFSLVIAILLRQFPQKNNQQPLATMACTLLGFLYVPFLFNYFTKLAFAWEPSGWLGTVSTTSRLLIFYLIAVVKFTDIGAFLIGSRWGRHKLIPRISPSKTWEGVIGGVAAGLLTSLIFCWALNGQLGSLNMALHDAIILGIFLPIMGILGDLTESMLKRAAQVKDTNKLIPGMGGVLDVLDSLLFAAPALFIYAKYILAAAL